jgi:hypothetical protein
MAPWFRLQAIVFLLLSGCFTAPLQSQEISARSLFNQAGFDRWAPEGPREQVPWKIRLLPAHLSLHQRLEVGIEVKIPAREMFRRRQDGRIVLLVQIADRSGHGYRNGGILDLNDAATKASTKDGLLSWAAFVLPGNYDVTVALHDQASGEHNLYRDTLRVDPLPNDPLPNLWRGLPRVEFWAPDTGLDSFYRADMEGRLNLPLQTARPVHLEVLVDLTPSDAFLGSTKNYERYLSGVLPILKTVSQITASKGSLTLAALNLDRRQVIVEQQNLSTLNWELLKTALAPVHGPGVVAVRSLEGTHSPLFLREELARRMEAAAEAPGPAGDPLVVFVVIGGPLDSYSIPDLPPLALPRETTYAVFYLQYDYLAQTEGRRPAGAGKNVQKMLNPLRVQTFTVRSAEDLRHAVASMLEHVSRM